MITSNVLKHLESYDILTDCQHGFRARRSCETHFRISRSRNPITTDYTLKGHTLTTEDYTKYLGVELQSTISWNRHIDQTVKKKANSMMGFLRRNLRVSSEATNASAYCSMVRPLLEYVPLFGVPIPRNISRRLRWFSVEKPGMSQTDIITQVV